MKRWYDRFEAIDQGRPHDMPSENYLDEIYAFFLNCYHFRDWLKNDSTLAVHIQQSVELHINSSRALILCADICNSLKHLRLTRTRSGENPAFGRKQFAVHLGTGVTTSISLKYVVITENDTVDAFSLATDCVASWETFLRANGLL